MTVNFGVDFATLEKNQKLKQSFHHQRIMESHIAAYAKEVVRSLTMQYIPCSTLTPSGEQMLRERTPEELVETIDRGILIAELTYQRMAEKGWLAEAPAASELLEENEGSMGFGGGNETWKP